MPKLVIATIFLLLNFISIEAIAVELKIVTKGGYVSFTVGDTWPVISMQSKLPIAAAGFQIPNPVDEGTSDSSNLALNLYDLSTEPGRTAFEKPVKQYGVKAPKIENFGEWTLYQQEAMQGATRYTILDAKKSSVADVSVSARLAWPHLKSNPKTHDSQMFSVFKVFLESVHGDLGPYVPLQNEVIRRPEK